MSIVEVSHVIKSFGDTHAVVDVSFAVERGEIFGLLGPNGAGKTTTVEMMEGITTATSGAVLYRDSPLGAAFREQAGIQFQHTALQDYLTVEETGLFRLHCPSPTCLLGGVIKQTLTPIYADAEEAMEQVLAGVTLAQVSDEARARAGVEEVS